MNEARAWLGGRLVLRQPAGGHRVGADAALLAAFAPGDVEGLIVDAGAGVGAAGIALASRSPRAKLVLVEIDPDLVALAGRNLAENALSSRGRAVAVDLMDARGRMGAGLPNGSAALVLTNPPFYEEGRLRLSPDAARARAHALPPGGLTHWLRACAAMLAPGGRLALIHRPEALAAILAALAGRIGAIAVTPVHPTAGAPAGRILVAGVKGSRAPLAIRPRLILHEASGAFTPEAEAAFRGEPLSGSAAR